MTRVTLSLTEASISPRPLWPLGIAAGAALLAAPIYLFLLDVPLIRATGWPMFALAGAAAVVGLFYARRDDRTWVRIAGGANLAFTGAIAVWFFWALSLPAADAKSATFTAAPPFELSDQNGRIVSLRDELRSGSVLLVFYRGSWCPFCVSELRGLSGISAELKRLGVGILAVSVDSAARSQSAAERLDLKFPLLGDHERSVIREYGVVHARGGPNGDDIAIPAHFLLDSRGQIVWRHIGDRVQSRPDPQEILRIVREHAVQLRPGASPL